MLTRQYIVIIVYFVFLYACIMETKNVFVEIRPTDLPCPNPSVMQILDMCSLDDSAAADIADLVAQDPLLTAELLRVVNTPSFGLAAEVKTMKHALSVLGMKAVRNLVLCLAVRDLMSSNDIDGFEHQLFREDTLRRAAVARMLATHVDIDSDEAFTAGMLQDMGMLALFYVNPAKSKQWERLRLTAPDIRLRLEQQIFNTRHDLVGQMLAEQWYLPAELHLAIGYHHRLEKLDETQTSKLACVLFCADWLAAVYTSTNTGSVLSRCRKLLREQANISEHQLDELIKQVPENVDQAGMMMGISISGKDDFDQIMTRANLQIAEASIGYQELTWRLQKTLKERDALAAKLHEESESARKIQRSLLPDDGQEEKVRAFNLPAHLLSGDFYDYFRDTEGHLWICLGDVAGKGTKASILMAKTIGLFRCLARNGGSPSHLMMRLNSELLDTYISGMFVTMVIGKLDSTTGSLELVNAGHPPALLIQGRNVKSLAAKALPLGIMQNVQYQSVELQLVEGVVYLYSDGVIESHDSNGDELDIKGFIKMLGKVHALPLPDRMTHMKNYFSKLAGPQLDDITLLALEH